MSALELNNLLQQSKTNKNQQAAVIQTIASKFGSPQEFYNAVAQEAAGVNHMQQQSPQPQQNTLTGARANTPVPQAAPPQLNGNKMNSQIQGMQAQGAGTAQAVNTAAQNPNNMYAKGGPIPNPPTPMQIKDELAAGGGKGNMPKTNSSQLQPKEKQQSSDDQMEEMFKEYSTPQGQQFLKDRAKLQQQPMQQAKGGAVSNKHESIKNMSLKDVIKMLASHPGLGGEGAASVNSPMQGQDMRAGGDVMGQHDPDNIAKRQGAHQKSESHSHGLGLLNMNADVPTYAEGGSVDSTGQTTDEVQNNDTGAIDERQGVQMSSGGSTSDDSDNSDSSSTNIPFGAAAGAAKDFFNGGIGNDIQGALKVVSGLLPFASTFFKKGGSVGMAVGGGLEGDTEADNIKGYGPDGTPIIENADGTQSYGNVNELLDRPSNAPTAETGQTPTNSISKNSANSLPQTSASMMAKGGESSNPPPGSLSEEVADNIPAQLSPGEFVFSADVVRFFGLQKLNAMMEFARQALHEMEQEGNIRSPGDGKNPDENEEGEMAQFMQDKEPNEHAYDNQPNPPEGDKGADDVSAEGLLKECMGGYNMNQGGSVSQIDSEFHNRQPEPQMYSQGGGVSEENFYSRGGKVDHGPAGRDNMVSAHPKGGNPMFDYARGGIVSSTGPSMTPKKVESAIPSLKTKAIKAEPVKIPSIKTPKIATTAMNKGGLLQNRNEKRDINQTMSYIGS
jgi:hypothetical protein